MFLTNVQKKCTGKRMILCVCVKLWGNSWLLIHMQKRNLEPYLILHIKINWNWIRELSIKLKNVQQKPIGKEIFSWSLARHHFLEQDIKAQSIKRTNWWKERIHTKLAHKNTSKKMMGKIYIYDEGCMFRVCEKLLLVNNMIKIGKRLNIHGIKNVYVWRIITWEVA